MTLIELLVTIVIMAVAFEVVVGGFASSILLSDRHRRQTSASTVVASVAEEVRGEPSSLYADCAASYPIPSGVAIPSGMNVSATVVGRWNPTANRFDDPADPDAPACSTPDSGLQLVRVTATATARPVTETVDVIKRRP